MKCAGLLVDHHVPQQEAVIRGSRGVRNGIPHGDPVLLQDTLGEPMRSRGVQEVPIEILYDLLHNRADGNVLQSR